MTQTIARHWSAVSFSPRNTKPESAALAQSKPRRANKAKIVP